ncbi:MAG: hypothetical protein A3K26_06835, partial [Tenericutes bacterium RIFOXYA12_FULL_35_10]
DGAKTLDEAVSMLKRAHEIGIHSVVLTPHVSLFRGYKISFDLIKNHFEMLRIKVSELGLSLNLYLGAEIDEHDHLIETLKKGYTFEGTPYVLIDFSMRESDVSEILYDLRHSGYKVIVAHPERIDYLSYQNLRQLKAEGALFQVSSSHLLPWKMDRASRLSKRLLKDGLIDFVASDSHRIDTLITMRQSYHYVMHKMGESKAQELFIDNPTKTITKTTEMAERN